MGAFNKGASEDKEEEEEESDEEERSSGLTYYKLADTEAEEVEEEEERSARVIEEASEVLNDLTLEETSQNLIVNPEEEVTELEVEGRTFEEVSSTTTSATTTAAATMTPIIAVPVQKIQQLIDALEVLKVFFV